MSDKIIIAIDGPAASGKGTLAKKIAEHYRLSYMDTGTLYRATAFEVQKQGLSIKDKRDVIHAAEKLAKKIEKDGPEAVLGHPTLREDKIGLEASKVAAMPEVRQVLLDIQRNFANKPVKGLKGAVLDGRDIGTVICPHADVKIFVTAKVETRAQRRLKELQSKGIRATYVTVLEDMRERDARDEHTLKAHLDPNYQTNRLDTTDLSPFETFDEAIKIIEKAGIKS